MALSRPRYLAKRALEAQTTNPLGGAFDRLELCFTRRFTLRLIIIVGSWDALLYALLRLTE